MKVSVFAAVALAAAALAQEPPRPVPPQQLPQVNEARAFLGLSDAQIQKLRSLEQQKGKALQALFQEIGEKEKSLHSQLQSGSANATAVGTLVLEIENLHKKVGQMDGNYHDQAVKLLEPGQAEKLKRLEDAARVQQLLEEANRLKSVIGQAASLQLVSRPPSPPVEPGPGRMGPRGPAMGPRNAPRNPGPPMGPGGPPPEE